jgi:two-component system, LytTR family, sensor histidine kinase AlgZ
LGHGWLALWRLFLLRKGASIPLGKQRFVQMQDAMEQQGSSGEHASGAFFIPDLCAPRPLLFLVLLAELMVLIYTLTASNLPRFDWHILATASILVQWLVLASAVALCLLRDWFSRHSLLLAASGSIFVVLLVTGFSSELVVRFYPPLMGLADDRWWLLRNLLVAALITGIALRYFYLQQQLTLRERSELQARIDALTARIRPHFLFNTLNSIASLIASHPERAEAAVEDLADLFRASLRQAGRADTVAEEVHRCELYLGIERLRLGDRLQVDWQIAEAVGGLSMPSLILQPLIENAVYHGVSLLPAGGVVRIRLTLQGNVIHAMVENPRPEPPDPSSGERMALMNIKQRLQALYGEEASLVHQAVSGYFRVAMHYPAERAA